MKSLTNRDGTGNSAILKVIVIAGLTAGKRA
jgi:hypothetical protein